jgi:hypothetical protein
MRRRGQRVMMKLKMRLMSSPQSPLVAMEKGQLKKNPATNPILKRAKPHMSIKAVQLLEFLLNISKEQLLTSAPKPLLGLFLPFHQMSEWLTLLSS